MAPHGAHALASSPVGRPEIHALTGLRGVAAAWVMAFHLRHHLEAALPWLVWLRPILGAGYVGVDLFFTLSGFLIERAYGDRLRARGPREVARFLWLRLARIYPVYLLTLAAAVALAVAHRKPIPLRDLAAEVAMVQAWLPHSPTVWNLPSWSVSAEWLAYLTFPVLAPLLARARRPGQIALLVLLGWTAVILPVALLFEGRLDLGLAGGVVRVPGSFLAGAALSRLEVAGRWRTKLGAAALIGCGLIVLALWLGHPLVVLPLFGLVLLCLARGEGLLSRLLEVRALRHLGRISYALYLVHGLVLLRVVGLVDRLALERGAAGAVAFASVGASLVLAHLLYGRFEEPCRRALHRTAL